MTRRTSHLGRIAADGGTDSAGSERICLLCDAELMNDFELDTGVCDACAEEINPEIETWLVVFEWMDSEAEWRRTDYPVVAENEDEALRKANQSDWTPDGYSDVSARILDTDNHPEESP